MNFVEASASLKRIPWIIPCYFRDQDNSDIKPLLEKLGFVEIEKFDIDHYLANLPEGWTSEQKGVWANIFDQAYQLRLVTYDNPKDEDTKPFLIEVTIIQ